VARRSTGRKVARAAGIGGSRTVRGTTPWGWYSTMALVVVLGVAGIVYSRDQRISQLAGGGPHPNGRDHWHAAYAIDICGESQPNVVEDPNVISTHGLHTHADGLIHVEPFVTGSAADTGNHATLARFLEGVPGFKLTNNELRYPGGKLYKNGQSCAGRPGSVQIRVWPDAKGTASSTLTDAKKIRIRDGMAITIGFVSGTQDVPKPASIPRLANPSAAEPGAASSTTTPPLGASSQVTQPSGTIPPSGGSTTSAPSGSPPTSGP
jgi:hypothetical protein